MFSNLFPAQSPLVRTCYKWAAVGASLWFRFPSGNLNVIGITGSKGKTTTSGLLHHILNESERKAGLITSEFMMIDGKRKTFKNQHPTPWEIQRALRRMCRAKCEFVVVELSSSVVDQMRFWGVNLDTVILLNIDQDNYPDYYPNSAEYVQSKGEIFRWLNRSSRKPNIPKMAIVNRDIEYFDIIDDIPADKKWTFSVKKSSDYHAENFEFSETKTKFSLTLPNDHLQIESKLIGKHNLENIIAAIATSISWGVPVASIPEYLKTYCGVPGQIESIDAGQSFGCVVDRSLTPERLESTLEILRKITTKRLIVIWGGKAPIDPEIYQESIKHLTRYADEIILTTDDPAKADPKKIAQEVRHILGKEEGEGFFEIEDRYEAIRYALYCAESGDLVLIAGRGDAPYQLIGSQQIPFDDRVVAREILSFAQEKEMI